MAIHPPGWGEPAPFFTGLTDGVERYSIEVAAGRWMILMAFGSLANPVCAAAALAVLQVMATEDLVRHAAAVGTAVRHGIDALGHPLIDHVRGRGLLWGIALTAPRAKQAEAAARDAGFLINAVAPDVIRLAPPLIITHAQIDGFVAALPCILYLAVEMT